jgi:serine/threonine protein kinase
MLGQIVGNYKLIAEIGQGGMGVVYRGEHIHLGTIGAVKLIHPSFSQIPGFIERFKREANAMMQLTHPHIVHVFDMGVQDDTYYMAMEYVDGESLMPWRRYARLPIEHPKHPSVEKILQVIGDVCEGLDYAHQHGFIHRDLKPSNILLDKQQGAKISDFGLVKIVGKEALSRTEQSTPAGSRDTSAGSIMQQRTKDVSLTMTGTPVGTFDYMSPEQRQGKSDIDQRADIYSIGVVLYELLTGRLPMGRVKDPSSYNPQVSKELDEFVLKSLETVPAERYRSISIFHNQLRWIIQNQKEYVAELQREREAARQRTEELELERQRKLVIAQPQEKIPLKKKTKEKISLNIQRKLVNIGIIVLVIIVFAITVKWCFNILNYTGASRSNVKLEEVGYCDTPGIACGVLVVGNYAYVADGKAGLRIIDISSPSSPKEVGAYDTPGVARNITIIGNYVYVADGETGLRIIDISSQSSPKEVGSYDTPGIAIAVAINGNYAYVADGKAGLRVIDVSNPSNPNEVGFYDKVEFSRGLDLKGSYLYLADAYSGIRVIDVSNPTNPREIGSYDTPGIAYSVAVSGKYAYIAHGSSGQLEAYMHGFSELIILNIKNPSNPKEIGSCNIVSDPIGFAYGITVRGNYAYVACSDAGLYIIDIRSPSILTEISSYQTPGINPGEANGVTINGNYIYVAYGEAGLRIIKYSNKRKKDSTQHDSRFQVSGDGIIVDTITGLKWVPNLAGNKTLDEAKQYAENLRLGGYTDWRLPSLNELQSLYEPSKETKLSNRDIIHIDQAFKLDNAMVWSSTNVFSFYFSNGRPGLDKNSTLGGVLVVRSSQKAFEDKYPNEISQTLDTASQTITAVPKEFSTPEISGEKRFQVSAEGIITDTRTGLEWAPDPGRNMNWEETKKYVESLILGGYSDWRLPTQEELEELYDRSIRAKLRIDPVFKLGGIWVWTSREDGGSWVVNFQTGTAYPTIAMTMPNTRVLAVRAPRK